MPVKGPDVASSTVGDLAWMLLEKVSLRLKREEESFVSDGCLYVVLCRGQQRFLKPKLASEDRPTWRGQHSRENHRKIVSWMISLSC